MIDKAPWLNLDDVLREVTETPTQGPDDLAVWGGAFDATRLDDFLQAWGLPRSGMPWSLWQWTDKIHLGHGEGSPGDLDYLERGRVFGEGGDLSLRRDGDRFLWYFVGEPRTSQPQGFNVADYWEGREDKPVRSRQRTALLWGSKEAAELHGKTGWYEDRVGQAELDYPNINGDRVQVCYREYLRGGRVELVWLLGLEPAPQPAEEEEDDA